MADEFATEHDKAAVDQLVVWRKDPVQFVRDMFDAEPDEWQKDALYSARDKKRTALSACKGPGKSTVKSWIGWWLLYCFQDAQGIALSITGKNLKDGLWKEFAVWYSVPSAEPIRAAFEMGGERITHRERPKTWFLSARSFPQSADAEQQASTLAGLHALVMFILMDEMGDYPPGVLPAAEAIFANPGGTKRLVGGGNPTSTSGPLYWIVTQAAHTWNIIHITGDPDDPKRSPRIDIDWAREQIRQFGRDNAWVRVNVLGLFPLHAVDTLMGINDVLAAQQQDYPRHFFQSDARIWGFDPAYSEDGDEAVLIKRQGVVAFRCMSWRGKDGAQLAHVLGPLLVEAEKNGEGCDALFIDAGGGGIACGLILENLGWREIVHVIDFGSESPDLTYENMRVYMWFHMAQWIKKAKPCIPTDPILQKELIAPKCSYETVNKRTVLRLESKKKMRVRGIKSPNRADALALTFAMPVVKIDRLQQLGIRGSNMAEVEYDPYA